jgi:hypothetical protein
VEPGVLKPEMPVRERRRIPPGWFGRRFRMRGVRRWWGGDGHASCLVRTSRLLEAPNWPPGSDECGSYRSYQGLLDHQHADRQTSDTPRRHSWVERGGGDLCIKSYIGSATAAIYWKREPFFDLGITGWAVVTLLVVCLLIDLTIYPCSKRASFHSDVSAQQPPALAKHFCFSTAMPILEFLGPSHFVL